MIPQIIPFSHSPNQKIHHANAISSPSLGISLTTIEILALDVVEVVRVSARDLIWVLREDRRACSAVRCNNTRVGTVSTKSLIRDLLGCREWNRRAAKVEIQKIGIDFGVGVCLAVVPGTLIARTGGGGGVIDFGVGVCLAVVFGTLITRSGGGGGVIQVLVGVGVDVAAARGKWTDCFLLLCVSSLYLRRVTTFLLPPRMTQSVLPLVLCCYLIIGPLALGTEGIPSGT